MNKPFFFSLLRTAFWPNFTLLLCFLALLSCRHDPSSHLDQRSAYNLLGKVKYVECKTDTVTQINTTIHSHGCRQAVKRPDEIYPFHRDSALWFNYKGQLIESMHSVCGDSVWLSRFEYDETGRVTNTFYAMGDYFYAKTSVGMKGARELIKNTSTEHGSMIREGKQYRTELDYLETPYGANSWVKNRKRTFVYRDDRALLETEEQFEEKGDPGMLMRHAYDSMGRLIRSRSYMENWIAEVNLYSYDDNRRTKEEKSYLFGELYIHKVTKYDTLGRLLWWQEFDTDNPNNDSIVFRKELKYNSSGLVASFINYKSCARDDPGVVHRYQYGYDEQGNWIRREEYINDTLRYVTRRKVQYYKN